MMHRLSVIASRYAQGVVRDIAAIYRWCGVRGVTEVDGMLTGLMLWYATYMIDKGRETLDSSPVYHRLFNTFTYEGLIVLMIANAALYPLAVMRCLPKVHRLALAMTGAFWTFVAVTVYSITGHIYPLGIYIFIVFMALFRAGKLAFEEAS